jgi:hypothetical protein
MSMTPKSVGYDRAMPAPDFDALPYGSTGVLPIGAKGAGRHGGARNRQQPRNPITSRTET